jgi:hypothetical protein
MDMASAPSPGTHVSPAMTAAGLVVRAQYKAFTRPARDGSGSLCLYEDRRYIASSMYVVLLIAISYVKSDTASYIQHMYVVVTRPTRRSGIGGNASVAAGNAGIYPAWQEMA